MRPGARRSPLNTREGGQPHTAPLESPDPGLSPQVIDVEIESHQALALVVVDGFA